MTEYASLVLKVDSTQADKATKSLSSMEYGSEKVEAAVKEMTAVMQRGFMLSVASTNNAASAVMNLEEKTKKLGKTTNDATSGMHGGFTKLIAVAATYLGVTQVTQYADAYTNLTNRLKLVTDSSYALAAATDSVFQIAQRSRSELGATGDLYFKIAQNADKLKLSTQDVGKITETITQTLAISGATASSSAAAILQFSQALASGAIRGDEFNSVAENAPALMDALSRSLNVTKGELRALAADGRLTADILIRALQEQADEVGAAFAKTDSTIGQSFTRLGNATTVFIGQAAESTGASKAMASAISSVADAISGEESALRDTAVVAASAATAYGLATLALNAKAIALRAASAAQLLFNTAVKANPYVMAATALAGLAAAFVIFKRDANPAIQSAEDFDAQLASMTGNTKALLAAQNDLKLSKIMDEIRSRTEQIASIQEQAALSNAKLGLGETQRIQELQRQLAALGKAYQDVQGERAATATPISAAAMLAATPGKEAKEKKAGAGPSDNFDYGAAGLNFNALDTMAAEEAASAQAYSAARMERLTTQFQTEREAELLRYTQEQEDFKFYAEQKLLTQDEINRRELEMKNAHDAAMIAAGELTNKAMAMSALGSAESIFGAFAARSKTMFKLQKAAGIAQGLVSIQTGIANAMSLPWPLNLAAAANVAVTGAGIMGKLKSMNDSGGGSIGLGGGGSISPGGMASTSPSVAPAATVQKQTTDIRLTGIRPDDMISGSYLQKIIEGIGETLADNGGRMGRVELVTA